MPLFFIIAALVILCLPLTVNSRSLAEAEGNYIIQNITLRPLPSFALKIELDGGGVVISKNKKSKKISGQAKSKNKSRGIPFELSDLKPIRLKELSVRGSFGGDSALQTAVVCVSAANVIALIYRFLPQAEKFSADIMPNYSKSGLQIAIKIDFQVNLLMIFFIFFSILFRKLKDKE
ncbi:MAG: hypothetical protein WC292_06390 [Clostridia bacterium]